MKLSEIGVTKWKKTSINKEQIIIHPRIRRDELRCVLIAEAKRLSKLIGESGSGDMNQHVRLLNKGVFIWLVGFASITEEELK